MDPNAKVLLRIDLNPYKQNTTQTYAFYIPKFYFSAAWTPSTILFWDKKAVDNLKIIPKSDIAVLAHIIQTIKVDESHLKQNVQQWPTIYSK